MIETGDIQQLDDGALLELYDLVKEHIQFLEGNIIDTSEEGDEEDE